MIIVEGPDGGGKTTLLRNLMQQFPSIPLHERASRSGSEGGPVDHLYDWAHTDVMSWNAQPLSFYDRHPLISEYIYGPVIRQSIDAKFLDTNLRRLLMRRALVIVCLPPLDAVRRSVSAERDMPGVRTHIDTIWELYASLGAYAPTSFSIRYYDYTKHNPTDTLYPYIYDHATYWSTRNG